MKGDLHNTYQMLDHINILNDCQFYMSTHDNKQKEMLIKKKINKKKYKTSSKCQKP